MGYSSEGFTRVTIFSQTALKEDPSKNRCSNNFRLDKLREGSSIVFYFNKGLIFDLMQDHTAAVDEMILENVRSGEKRQFPSGSRKGLYVANVRDINGYRLTNSEPFVIDVEVIV